MSRSSPSDLTPKLTSVPFQQSRPGVRGRWAEVDPRTRRPGCRKGGVCPGDAVFTLPSPATPSFD